MSTKLESMGGIPDSVKWLVACAMLLAGIGAFHYFGDQSLLLRVIGLLILIAVVSVVVLRTEKGRIGWEFVRDARTEVRKVVWPTRRETMQTTGIVIVMVGLVAVMLWMLDTFLGWLVRSLLGQGG
jgi:preprotein translocase subunit SecE